MNTPKKFSWRIISEQKIAPSTIRCQEQCSSGGGGNGKCGTGK